MEYFLCCDTFVG